MPQDTEYLANYRPQTLYVHPGREGSYATLVSESEIVPVTEIEVTPRSKLAVSAFYVREKKDFGTFKLTKLKFHRTNGWIEDGALQINNFHVAQLRQFVDLLAQLDLSDGRKARIGLQNIQIDTLKTLLTSSQGQEMLKSLSNSPEFHEDIYAVASKRAALQEFEANLAGKVDELTWQSFFERNTWIFGHGLNYVFLDKVASKLEAATTGRTFNQPGKRADGLMHTRAEISQYVLIEIKRSDTDLLRSDQYRSGCWAASHELSSAVTQVQKTAFEFTRNRFRDTLKDDQGNDVGDHLYAVDPRSYLIVGHLGELVGNDDKVTCFELYRRNIRAPEIITFDELFHRAKCIVDNISAAVVREVAEDNIPY